MSAANSDKLIKLSRRWVGQIGSGGVDDETVTTIPLSATTNLPTDTAVIAVIDRVDVNGVATPTLEETVIGVVSSTNLINCLRGQEGTAQAHAAGAVVEILFTAKGWNLLVDHLLVQHGQDGVHTSALVTSLKATGAEIDTGTEDAKIVTPKAIADSGVSTATKTETFTNKTLTSPKINEDVALTSTSTELNALDGKTGEWLTSWNPTLNGITAGSGTKVSKYVQIGKIVHFFLSFALAADSSVSGRISFALPVNSKVGTFQVNGYAMDSGIGNMPLFAFAFSNAIYVDAFNTSTTYASSTSSSSTVPFTWTTADAFYISGTYEAA